MVLLYSKYSENAYFESAMEIFIAYNYYVQFCLTADLTLKNWEGKKVFQTNTFEMRIDQNPFSHFF